MLIRCLGLGAGRAATAIDRRISPHLSQQRMAAIRLPPVDYAQVAAFAELSPADPVGVNPSDDPHRPQLCRRRFGRRSAQHLQRVRTTRKCRQHAHSRDYRTAGSLHTSGCDWIPWPL